MMQNIAISDDYLYLVNSNSVINAELFKEFKNGAMQTTARVNEQISKSHLLENIKGLDKLVFEVTQNCNLKCKYCQYSGLYHFERKNSNLNMDFETARSGFDVVFNHIKERAKKELSIGFYGGEPFLGFDLIKKIVAYVKGRAKGWKFKFTLTTNGTKFTDEIISFLRMHNFSICISLDGPKEIHDRKRVYSNGDGTFDDVFENIQRIIRFDKDYFKTKVKFNSVLSKELPIIKAFDFFAQKEEVKYNAAHFNLITDQNTEYFNMFPYDVNEYIENLNGIIDRIKLKMLNEEDLLPFESSIYSNIIKVKGLWSSNRLVEGDACIFGAKLFIDCSGDFHLCEQVNNKFSYGNIRNGFDLDKMMHIHQEYLEICKKHCSNCEARFLCKRCYVTFAGNGNFVYNSENCKKRRKNLLDKLSEYLKFNQGIQKKRDRGNDKRPNVVRLHQYVEVNKGVKNTAIFDFLKGNIFQIENEIYDSFIGQNSPDVQHFIESVKKEELIITVPRDRWIPGVLEYRSRSFKRIQEYDDGPFNIEIDEDVDAETVRDKFKDFAIPTVYYFGKRPIENFFPLSQVVSCKKNFEKCVSKCRLTGFFQLVDMETYIFNMHYNSCWGNKLAITEDGNVRPCIYSKIVLGNMREDDIFYILEKAFSYWKITKDAVEKCRECELRYACFDCREIAYRKKNNLYAANPYCSYNPKTGKWIGEPDESI